MTTHRDHLRRLDASYYRGMVALHWSLTIRDRRVGWLSGLFYYRFRELVTHTAFRYGIACPIFCLMPDHLWKLLNFHTTHKAPLVLVTSDGLSYVCPTSHRSAK